MTPQELQHIAPILARIQKKGAGFKTPDTYFDEIENAISDQLFVDTLPKNSGYETPIDYFEQVENTVISKIENEIISNQKQDIPTGYFDTVEDTVFKRLALEKKPRIISLKKYWIPATIAASLLLLVSIYNPFDTKQTLELAEIEAWIDEGNLDIDSYEIAELYSDEMDTITMENTINTDELEDYLNDIVSEESFYN